MPKARKPSKMPAKPKRVLPPENLVRTKIRRLYFDEGFTYQQIRTMRGISLKRIGLYCGGKRTPEGKKLLHLRWFIEKHEPCIKEPKALREFMQQNYHRKNNVLAKYLRIEESAVLNLLEWLGLRGKGMKIKRRKEVMQAKIIALAEKIKARNPRELKFGYLAEQKRKGRSHLLNKIMLYFVKDSREWKEEPMKAYDRFLKALGLTREDVGTRRPGRREESKKRILAYVSEPRPSGDFYSKPREGKPRLGSHGHIPYNLNELVQEGKLIKRRVGPSRQYVYYYKPGQERMMDRIEQEMRRK